MKHFVPGLFVFLGALLPMLWSSPASARVPEITAPVNDYAHVLGDEEERYLTSRVKELRSLTGIQMAILTVNTTGGVPIDDFSWQVASKWEGGQAERDDGLLLTLAISDRRSRLEVGEGLEPWIPDGTAANILDGMVPALKAGNYGKALGDALNDIFRLTDGIEPGESLDPLWFSRVGLWLALILMLGIGLGYAIHYLKKHHEDVLAEDPEEEAQSGAEYAAKTNRAWRNYMAAHLVSWIAYPLLIALLFSGAGMVASIYFGLGGVVGGVTGLLVARWWYLWFGAGFIFIFLFAISAPVPVNSVADEAGILLLVFAITGSMIGGLAALVATGIKSGGGGGYGTSYSSSSYSSSSSSYSSSSSSSWSGGGGSFGGGGASGSW